MGLLVLPSVANKIYQCKSSYPMSLRFIQFSLCFGEIENYLGMVVMTCNVAK